MGSGVSTNSPEPSFVKVDVCNLSKSSKARELHTRIDDFGAIIGCEGKAEDGTNSASTTASLLLDVFEQQTGVSVSKHVINDKSGSFVLVARARASRQAKSNFYVVPRLEPFSRISGICKILGDRSMPSNEQYQLQVGDLFRIGSVGLVVTQICRSTTDITKITEEQMFYLKYKVLDSEDRNGPLGEATEGVPTRESKRPKTREKTTVDGDTHHTDSESEVSGGDQEEEDSASLCYVCCDPESSEDNPLVSACQCKGGTKWVHLNCLARMVATETENRSCVVMTENKDLVCKVCRTPYRKYCQLNSGKIIPIPQPHLQPPYICCKVVTHNAHSGAESSLFNATYQISAHNHMISETTSDTLFLGRSTDCDVQLNYQTVSARHAAINYRNGCFYLQDLRSSNGTFIYLREPLPLTSAGPTRVRMGRKTIKLTVSNSNGLSSLLPSRHSTDHSAADEHETVKSTKEPPVPFAVLRELMHVDSYHSVDVYPGGTLESLPAENSKSTLSVSQAPFGEGSPEFVPIPVSIAQELEEDEEPARGESGQQRDEAKDAEEYDQKEDQKESEDPPSHGAQEPMHEDKESARGESGHQRGEGKESEDPPSHGDMDIGDLDVGEEQKEEEEDDGVALPLAN